MCGSRTAVARNGSAATAACRCLVATRTTRIRSAFAWRLSGVGQIALNQQIGHLKEYRALAQFLDPVAPMLQDAGLTVDVRDRAPACGGVGESRIERHQTRAVVELIARKSSARSTRCRSRAHSCDRCGYRSACHRGGGQQQRAEIPARCGPAGSFPQPRRLEALVVVIGLLGLRLVARYEHRARRAAGDPFADAGERALSGQLRLPTITSEAFVNFAHSTIVVCGQPCVRGAGCPREACAPPTPARLHIGSARRRGAARPRPGRSDGRSPRRAGRRHAMLRTKLFVLWSLGCELKRRGDSVLAGDHPSTLERLAPLFDPCFRAGDAGRCPHS